MCTAITFESEDFFFGRTLDYERSFGEEVVLTPRLFPLPFRHVPDPGRHFAILGMALVSDEYPLYYDAMNEHGLCMAGLNFVGSARYGNPGTDKVAPFELIPWVLGRCTCAEEARTLLADTALVEEDFSNSLPCARLHWIIADRSSCFTVEAVESGLRILDNPAGVLTNEPPFEAQMLRLSDFMHLSPAPPVNRFSAQLDLRAYSRGLGAMGLPGDLSSQSRFVRAAFTKLNAAPGGVGQAFHVLGSVEQVKGCCRLENGDQEHTLYTAVCNATRRVYHYATYENRRIQAVSMDAENLDAETLKRFPLMTTEDIRTLNGPGA